MSATSFVASLSAGRYKALFDSVVRQVDQYITVMPYTTTLLESKEKVQREDVFAQEHRGLNSSATSAFDVSIIEKFHQSLPDYAVTKLHRLSSLASELGVAEVFIKDESTRLGLPAFKILGASWAIHRILCEKLELDPSSTKYQTVREGLEKTKQANGRQFEIVTCTEGNWGRACGRYATLVGVALTVYTPGYVSEYMRDLMASEGAKVEYLSNG